MAEYIEREQDKYIKLSQALEVLDSCACWWAHERMKNIPTADVQPVRHGRWIPHMESIETTVITASRVYEKGDSVQYGFTCSECGRWEENREPFCNCGAKMDAEATG